MRILDPDDSGAWLTPPARDAPDAWTAATAGSGGSQRLLEVVTVEPPQAVAEALEFEPGELAVVRRRLVLKSGRPVELADSYYPEALAAGTPLADPRWPAAIARLGIEVAYGEQALELDARPTPSEAELLRVTLDERVVRLFRTAYTINDTPFEVTAAVMLPAGRTIRDRILIRPPAESATQAVHP